MIRRVVTGHRSGKAVVVDDGVPPRTYRFQQPHGQEVSLVWASPRDVLVGAVPDAQDMTASMTLLPQEGESRLLQLKIPPLSVRNRADFDAALAAREARELLPEMAATRELEDPAMHRTDTLDYVIVLEGEVHLELDDGREVLLKPHDVVVQSGTRHAWRNRGKSIATIMVVMIGARRL